MCPSGRRSSGPTPPAGAPSRPATTDEPTPHSQAAPRARIWQEDIVIPTYEVGPPGRNPDLLRDGHRSIYPYTLRDDLLHRRRPVTYRAVRLENEYLRVTVLPELGGHIYSAYDKVSGQEMFYRNRVIKPARILLRGAWAAFGVEFNFPRGHSVTTLSPVDYRLLEHPDGSVSVAVGDCERMSRMRWTVIITLRPGARRIEVTTRLTNRTQLPHRYYFWANAAVPADEHLQFLSPARAARRFGVDLPFPYENGLDKRWYKNHFHSTDLFTVDCPYDFFGYYDHGRDFGVVHVADRHILPGKKFFTWGCGGDGLVWSTILSDEDGPYIEIQAGSHETQSDLSLFEPHSTKTWTEYWCPVWKLGPFDFATEKVALHLGFEPSGEAVLRLQASERLPGCSCRLTADGDEIKRWKVTLEPGPAVELRTPMPEDWETCSVEVLDARGTVLARYRTTRERPPEAARRKHPTARRSSPEGLYQQALAALKHGEVEAALKHLEGALRRDPHFSPALRERGMIRLSRGLPSEARADLEAALVRNREDDLARYYLALALRDLARREAALEEALTVAARLPWGWLGWHLAGELHLEAGRFVEAERALREVLRRQPALPRAQALLSAALRKQGRSAEALASARSALEADPLEHLALAELWLMKADEGLFNAVLRGEAQSHLEVACDYLRCGLLDEARLILEAYLAGLDSPQSAYPVVHYYLGYLAERLGQPATAHEHYRRAAALPYEYVFPHRLESLEVLRAALAHNPDDAHAHYYLGTLLASRGRYDEALAEWEKAVALKPSIAPAHRNIGLVRWRLHRQGRKAVAAYKRALAAAPHDQDLYWEADLILEALGWSRERVRLLASAPPEVQAKDKVAKRLAGAYYALGRYDEVLRVLRSTQLWPWEGERTAGLLYSGALTNKALRAFRRGRLRAARAYLEQSMVYPENLHLGRPAFPRFAKQRYFLARCLEQLGEPEEARRVLEAAAQERYTGWDQGYCEALYYKGLAALRLGRRGEARRIFQRLRRGAPTFRRRWFHPENVYFLQALGHRGLAEMEPAGRQERRKHLETARDLLQKALQERRDFPEAEAMLKEVEDLLEGRAPDTAGERK